MPIYEFQCNSDHTFEEWCSYEQSKLGFECPECGKKSKRIYSVSAVKPTFGNQDTLWNHREKHRKKHMIPNQSHTG
jgi:putative FmdB family regulatory protein